MISSKKYRILAVIVLLFLALTLCQCDSDDNSVEAKVGKIHFKCDMIEQSPKLSKVDTNLCAINNIKWTIEEIGVSTEPIVNGQPDDIGWEIIHINDSLKYFDEYDFDFELPVGDYQSIRIKMKNRAFWICDFGGQTYEFEDFNSKDSLPDADSPVNYFYSDGLHYLDPVNGFYLQTQDEKIGNIVIVDGGTTTVNWVINMVSLEWYDVNENGIWETGIDGLDNWALPDSVDTMFDFIITNE